MPRILNEFDTFKILLEQEINDNDYHLIFMLYQPLIGVEAANLYLTLLSEKHLTHRINLEFNHNRLKMLLNTNNFQLLEAFKNLEYYNLLNTYFNEEKSIYIYVLKKPLNAQEFLKNENFKNELQNKIGNLNFERQKYYFLKDEPVINDNFIDITEKKENKPSFLRNFLSKINNSVPTTKEKNFTPTINNSYNNHQVNNKAHANLKTEEVIKYSQSTNNFNSTVILMQKNSCQEYLTNLTKKPLNEKQTEILNTLNQRLQLSNEVINCLIDYVWFKNNQRLEPNYILKIAQTLKENKINDVTGTLNHLKLAYSKSKKANFKNNSYQQKALWTSQDEKLTTNEYYSEAPAVSSTNKPKTKEEIQKIIDDLVNL